MYVCIYSTYIYIHVHILELELHAVVALQQDRSEYLGEEYCILPLNRNSSKEEVLGHIEMPVVIQATSNMKHGRPT